MRWAVAMLAMSLHLALPPPSRAADFGSLEAIWAESADRHLDDSVDSQSTLVEQELERDRVHAEAMEQDRREAERLRLQAQFDAMQLDAMESAMGKAKEDAMRQNVPISWKSDIVFSSEDERVTVATEAIDRVGCTGSDG